MFLIDLEQGRIIDDSEIKAQLAASKPYRQWIDALRMRLDDGPGHGWGGSRDDRGGRDGQWDRRGPRREDRDGRSY